MPSFEPLRIVDVVPEAADAVALALDAAPALRASWRARAGQHIVVRASVNGEELRRTYSPVSAPGEWPLRIVVRVHPNGRLSRHLAEAVRAGDALEVLPPRGSFTPRSADAAGASFVAFAAGSGITPVIAVVRALLEAGAGRVLLFYGNTTTARTLCLEELQALKDRHLARLALHFVMSREPQEVELFNGRIDAARVRRFAAGLFAPQAVREYFLCGPGDMNAEVSATLAALGVAPERVHAERFSTADIAPGAAAPAAAPPPRPVAAEPTAAAAASCRVTVRMDGRVRTFNMEIGTETVLEAAARAGIELPYSCRAGVCSTCRTKRVRGEVSMRQNYALEEWELEQGYVLACQSCARSAELELDYDEK